LFQKLGEVGNGSVVEAPFALLDGKVEVLLRDTVVTSQVRLCLVPEVLDPVDVVGIFCEQLRVIDPHVMELGDIEDVIGSEAASSSKITSLSLWKNRIAVLRFTPVNSAAERAVVPAQKYFRSSTWIFFGSLLQRLALTI
jgi:hypothetical protein